MPLPRVQFQSIDVCTVVLAGDRGVGEVVSAAACARPYGSYVVFHDADWQQREDVV